MKPKSICKTVIDITMTVALLLQMAHQGLGDWAHEWIGVSMFALFIVHNLLNLQWYRSIFKGRYTSLRVLRTVLVFLVFAAMAGLIVSGVIMSRHVFVSLPISGGMAFARVLHMLSSHWGFVFMGMHLGLHWEALMGFARRLAKITSPAAGRTVVLRAAAVITAAYGGYALIKRDFARYMLLMNQFVFWNYEEPIVYFFLDYLAIMGLFVFIAHYGSRLLLHRNERPPLTDE